MVGKAKALLQLHIDTTLAMGATILLMVVLASVFDFRYDLNDDVLIHDILSGNYTGVPSGHNIQMLYPLSGILALCYRIGRAIPWYGIFLCTSQFFCFYLLVQRILTYAEHKVAKYFLLLVSVSFFLVFQYNTLVVVQYTVVAGLLAATGIFLFLTAPLVSTTKEMLKVNWISLVLLLVAYCLREEIVLLFLPLLCVTGVIKWMQEKELWKMQVIAKYVALMGAFLIGMLLCLGIHYMAYGSQEWKTFQVFFDQRTDLYDYATIPDYESNGEFYESIQMEESQQQLLVNYNYAMDSRIDVEVMTAVAEYATQIWQDAHPFSTQLRNSLWSYRYRTFYMEQETLTQSDYPYNYMVIILYGSILLMIAYAKSYRYFFAIGLLLGVRSSLWLYLIYGMRTPVRITMPLYYVEACILLGMLLYFMKDKIVQKYGFAYVMASIVFLGGIWQFSYLSNCLQDTIAFQEEQDQVNDAIREYAKSNPENVYFIDVYTFVYFSEEIFAKRDNSLDNYGIIGGWAATSPVETKRLEALDVSGIDMAFIEEEGVYFVNGTQYSTDWLVAYYKDKGIEVRVEVVDELLDGQIEIIQLQKV
ncbi:MAG: hypothetical protein R3Y67_00100 [Eubacteriales bacterium]